MDWKIAKFSVLTMRRRTSYGITNTVSPPPFRPILLLRRNDVNKGPIKFHLGPIICLIIDKKKPTEAGDAFVWSLEWENVSAYKENIKALKLRIDDTEYFLKTYYLTVLLVSPYDRVLLLVLFYIAAFLLKRTQAKQSALNLYPVHLSFF